MNKKLYRNNAKKILWMHIFRFNVLENIETMQQKLFEQKQILIHILQEVTIQDAEMWMQFC